MRIVKLYFGEGKVNLKKTKFIFFNTIMLIVLALLGMLFIKGTNESSAGFYNYLFCLFGTLVYFWCIWSWYKNKKGNFMSVYYFFVSSISVYVRGNPCFLC